MWNFSSIYGQKISLKVSAKDSLNSIILKAIHFQKKHSSETSLYTSLDSIKNKLIQDGFLNATIDTIIKKDTLFYSKLNLGVHHKEIRVYFDKTTITTKQLLSISLQPKEGYFDIDISNLPNTLNAIVGIFESQGASFTEISLHQISLKNNKIRAYLTVKNSTLRKIDKIIINGYSNFPKTFLKHQLQLGKGVVFSKEKLSKVSLAIQAIPFVSETKPPEVLFTKDSTIVYLALQKQASNMFDGLVGFNSNENDKGISFNGYLDITLQNIFNGGETFALYWKNNGADRQVLDLSLQFPYAFNSKFSPEATLNIYRQDTTFTTFKTKLSIPYAINTKNAIGLSMQSKTSTNLLSTNNNTSIDNYKKTLYGINFTRRIINQNSLFPIKFSIQGEILTGKRKNTTECIAQSQLLFNMSYLLSITFKSHVFFQNNTGVLFSNNIISNELFRIGGVNSIRGFNEESISASSYSYLNIEYRFTPNNSSYLYSITDFGYLKSTNNNQYSEILSLGLGYAFKTKIGLLNLGYAVGKFSNQPFGFNNSKLHLKVIRSF